MHYFAETAPALVRQGFEVLPAVGKAIYEKGWQTMPITEEIVAAWASNGKAACNVGVRCGEICAVDLDITDPAVVGVVQADFVERFGAGLVRIGNAPKVLLVYRAKAPTKKLQSAWLDSEHIPHKVEILGAGQQFIAFGRHPDTGLEYRWPEASLLDYETWELPEIDVEAVAQWLRDRLPEVLPSGWTYLSGNTQAAPSGDTVKKVSDPRLKKNVVGAFCRAYSVRDAIETFLADLYEPTGQKRYRYVPGTSKTGGLAIYEENRFAYSNHGTDPAAGQLLNAFDLVRVHRFGGRDDPNDIFDQDPTRSPSFVAMRTWAETLPEVQAEMKAMIETAANDWAGRIEAADLTALDTEVMPGIASDRGLLDTQRGELKHQIHARMKALAGKSPLTPAQIDKRIAKAPVLMDSEARRREQERIRERELAEGLTGVGAEMQRIFTLREMLDEVVYVREGSQVAFRNSNRSPLKIAAFGAEATGSRIVVNGEAVPVTTAWLASPGRRDVDTVTFAPGRPEFCRDPENRLSLNLWRPIVRDEVEGWEERVKPFLELVEFLVPVARERDRFLDWLAHLEQRPGELPHAHYLMFTRQTGVGRNLLASILGRVWSGYVALDFDLVETLEGGFNGRLSKKLLAVVNELHEGGNDIYRLAEKLKTFLNSESRLINPKYGHQHVEYNCCRVLMFSNHAAALPLDETDRRVIAIQNPETRRDPEYYREFYQKHRADPEFIAAIACFLAKRDISGFNPGEVAPMNEAKRKVVAANESEQERAARALIEYWPADCVTSGQLMAVVMGDDADRRRFRPKYIMSKFGIQRREKKLKIEKGSYDVMVLRNHDKWMDAAPSDVRDHIVNACRILEKEALAEDKYGATGDLVQGPAGCRHVLEMLQAEHDHDFL